MPTLSIIIITKNEAHHIETCLQSIQWANEIIVVDSGSTDNTVELCKRYTEKVFITDWPGFGPQKNRALQYATSDWVLSIDADEHVGDELKKEILTILANPASYCAYAIPRISSYMGKKLRYGGWRNDYPIRLFQREKAKFGNDIVHEKIETNESVGKLNYPLYHESFQTLEEVINKINSYSTLSAKMKQQRGKKSSLLTALSHGLWTFIRDYLLKLGFLDGREGFMSAFSRAEGSYYRYMKLFYLNKKSL